VRAGPADLAMNVTTLLLAMLWPPVATATVGAAPRDDLGPVAAAVACWDVPAPAQPGTSRPDRIPAPEDEEEEEAIASEPAVAPVPRAVGRPEPEHLARFARPDTTSRAPRSPPGGPATP
jgi:hypothetical protein